MPTSRTPTLSALACLAVLLVALPLVAQSESGEQEPTLTLVLEGNARPQLRLAMPPFQGLGAVPPTRLEAINELHETLRADLEASGIFVIQGPEELSVLDLTGETAHDIDQYRSLGNEVALEAEVHERSGRLVVEGRVVDLGSRKDVLAKRYRGDYSIVRRIAHTFSDDVILHFTGRKGLGLTSIAFWSDRSEFREIYVMDYDGHNQRQITAHKSISMSPTWSPQLDGLAYVSYFAGSPGVYFADLATGRKSPIVADDYHNAAPSFSPDGRQIVFARSLGGNWDIFVADRDGRNERRLTHSPQIDTNPSWSPNGREIAFTSSRSGRPQIYLMDIEGANLRRVSFDGDYNDGAAWHPAGTHVVYASRRHGNYHLALTDLVTLETQLLTSGSSNNETPSFSPDGRQVVFSSNRDGRPQIYVVDIRSRQTRRLTSQGRNWAPSWSGYLE
ncbi:MAG: Tol-Pal system beta propeller repeat protein TolB [Thermoanaerobaculia bacterium]|nr:Tol-Pal system beta propeller repeat protein TolB [Thermoanaerobaculia bacterium]